MYKELKCFGALFTGIWRRCDAGNISQRAFYAFACGAVTIVSVCVLIFLLAAIFFSFFLFWLRARSESSSIPFFVHRHRGVNTSLATLVSLVRSHTFYGGNEYRS